VGPGRFELPTSRLSGVRSKPTELRAPGQFSISDFRLTILLKKSQIGNRKPTILPGSSVITIYLKKSNKKTAARTASGLKSGHQQLSVNSSEQIKDSQNLFQNPNQILSYWFGININQHPKSQYTTLSSGRQHYF
jgi:hypothetical protein